MIYFDNNATTIMPQSVLKAMLLWSNKGNPSASYTSAVESRAMMTKFRKYIGKICRFEACCEEPRDAGPAAQRTDPAMYKIIFTSSASESNCMVIQSVVESFMFYKGRRPHLIVSSIEHKSVVEQVTHLVARDKIDVTFVRPLSNGQVDPADIAGAIQPTTCLICVMHANNETGVINDINAIGRVAHSAGVPFHTDAVQTFGKFPLNPIAASVDSFSVSFHKFGGPPGVGALVIKQQFLAGYKLCPMIFGSQNEGLRGGTENLPGIGASFEALSITMVDRAAKNRRMLGIKKYIIGEFAARLPVRSYVDYLQGGPGAQKELEIVFFTADNCLPGTILLSIVKRSMPHICNQQVRGELERRGIIVSIGSACNTASPKASHVLFAMGADELIRKGTLRISLGDSNTLDEAKKFVKEFLLVLKSQTGC